MKQNQRLPVFFGLQNQKLQWCMSTDQKCKLFDIADEEYHSWFLLGVRMGPRPTVWTCVNKDSNKDWNNWFCFVRIFFLLFRMRRYVLTWPRFHFIFWGKRLTKKFESTGNRLQTYDDSDGHDDHCFFLVEYISCSSCSHHRGWTGKDGCEHNERAGYRN